MLVSLVLGCLAMADGGDAEQGKPLAGDPDRPPIPAAEIKALRDNNIFAPRTANGGRPRPAKSGGGRSEPVSTKPKPPVVTGLFFDPKSKGYQIVIEDRNDASLKYFKEPRYLKAGDEWCGLKVESVAVNQAVCTLGSGTRVLQVGESLPEGDWKPASAAKPSEDPLKDDEFVPGPEENASPSPGKKAESSTPSAGDRARVLEEMKRRAGKKNRPVDPEE